MLNTDAKLLWEQFISQRKPGQSLPLEDLKRHAAKALGMKGEHVEGHLRELRHVLTNDGFKVSVTDRGIDVIAGKLSLEDAVAGKLPKSPVT